MPQCAGMTLEPRVKLLALRGVAVQPGDYRVNVTNLGQSATTAAGRFVVTPDPRNIRKAIVNRVILGLGAAGLTVLAVWPGSLTSFLVLATGLGLWLANSLRMIYRSGRRQYLVASEAGLETNWFGTIGWDEIAAIRVRTMNDNRAFELWVVDRRAVTRRATHASCAVFCASRQDAVHQYFVSRSGWLCSTRTSCKRSSRLSPAATSQLRYLRSSKDRALGCASVRERRLRRPLR